MSDMGAPTPSHTIGPAPGTRTGSPVALRPVLVGGCPRSGTTMLGAMLGHGPDILTVPEAAFKWQLLRGVPVDGPSAYVATEAVAQRLACDWRFGLWSIDADEARSTDGAPDTYEQVLHRLVRAHGRVVGKPDPSIWVDHTPLNLKYAMTLAGLLPGARFVHLLRDGRGVAASVLSLDWGPDTIREAATWWAAHVAMGLAAATALGPSRVHTVRYEDLLLDGPGTLRGICDFLEVPFTPAMLSHAEYHVQPYTQAQHELVSRPPDSRRADAWRTELPPRAIEEFEHVTGELLGYLGYPLLFGAVARASPRSSRLRDATRKLIVGQVVHRSRRWSRRTQARTRLRVRAR